MQNLKRVTVHFACVSIMIAEPKKHSGMKAICGYDLGAVITPGRARSPKKEGFFTKAKVSMESLLIIETAFA